MKDEKAKPAELRGRQELDETALWLELLVDSDTMKSMCIQPLQREVEELISIFVTMTRKVKAKR